MTFGLEVFNKYRQTIFTSEELHMRHVKTVVPNRTYSYVFYDMDYYSWGGSLTESAMLSVVLPSGSFYSFALVRRGDKRFPSNLVPASHNLAVLSIVERLGSSTKPTFYIFDKATGVNPSDAFGIVTYRSNGDISLSSSSPLMQVIDTTVTPVTANFNYLPTAFAGNKATPLISVDNLFYDESDANRLELRVKRVGNDFYLQANYELTSRVGDKTHRIRTNFISMDSIRV